MHLLNMHKVLFLCLLLTISHVKADTEIDLKDKVAVVTGAAKGIGRAIADNLLKEEVSAVIIVDKNLTKGIETEAELKATYGADKVWFIHGDVNTDLERVFKEIFERYDYVDILVNNAGIVDEYDPVGTLITNMLAPALWSQKFYNVMRKDKDGKGGTILNIASEDSYLKDPFFWFYKASKYGILGLSVGLGHEWNCMTTGVRVIALCPGYTYTDMTKQQLVIDEQVDIFVKFQQTLSRQSADAVGQAAISVCKNGTTGIAYTIAGGELSVSPYGQEVTLEDLLSLE